MGLLDEFSASVKTEARPSTVHASTGVVAAPSFSSLLFIFSLVTANIASGYTTFYGLKETIDQPVVALLATFAIQGMMLGAALRIAQQKTRKYLFPLLLLYLAPMVVSIIFNYIFFHALFYETATARAKPQNELIRIRNIQSTMYKETSVYLSSIRANLQAQIQTARSNAAREGIGRQDELTVRGTGGAGPGKHYRDYRDTEQADLVTAKALNDLDSSVSSLQGKLIPLIEKGDLASLQNGYGVLLEISSIAGAYSSMPFPAMPRVEMKAEMKLGESHSVFEALRSLLSPTLFEIISLVLGILMDSVIFVWVMVRFVSNMTLVESAI